MTVPRRKTAPLVLMILKRIAELLTRGSKGSVDRKTCKAEDKCPNRNDKNCCRIYHDA